MSDEKENVQEPREKAKDQTEEEGEKCVTELKGAFSVTLEEEDREKSARRPDPEIRNEVVKQLRQEMEKTLKTASKSFEMYRKKEEEARKRDRQTSSEKCDPNSSSPAQVKMMANMKRLPGEVKPGEVDKLLYEAFLGAEYKEKPIVDMFGFSPAELQALDDWTRTKKDFLKALPENEGAAAKATEEAGANVCDPKETKDKTTALILACSFGNAGAAYLLLKEGARVNGPTLGGRTPLMEAAECGRLDVLLILLKYGADVNVQDSKGNTALSLARQAGHKEVVELLESVVSKADSAKEETKSASAEDPEQMDSEPISTEDPTGKESSAHCENVPENPNVQPPVVHEEQSNLELRLQVRESLSEELLAAKDSLPPTSASLPPAAASVVRQISSDYCSSDSSDQVVPDITRPDLKDL